LKNAPGGYRVRKTVDGKTYSFTFDHKPTQKEIGAAVAGALNKNVTLRNALSASTIAGYKSYLENIGSDFVELAMKDIDSVAVQKVANDLAADHSPKTVKNEPYIPTSEEVRAILDASNDKYYIVLMLGCWSSDSILKTIYQHNRVKNNTKTCSARLPTRSPVISWNDILSPRQFLVNSWSIFF
jgi:hypothetical protein